MSGQIGTAFPSTSAHSGNLMGKLEENAIKTNATEQTNKTEQTAQTPITKEDLTTVVNGMNEFLKASPQTHLKFEFHDQLNEYYVTLVDEVTNEVVREIPPKKLLDMFAAMNEYIGLMVDKKI